MSKVKIKGNASGTGVLTIEAPNTNTDSTITLPDGDVTLGVGIDDNATSTAITIDSSENVGIGTSSPSVDLHINNTTGSELRIDTIGGDNADSVLNFRENGVDRASLYWDGADNDLYLETTVGDIALMPTGNVGVGETTPTSKLHIKVDGNTAACCRMNNTASGTGSSNTAIFQRNGSNVGFIKVTGSSTAYNTSSDYRLKENVVPMTGSIDRLKELKPSRFNFIVDADTTVDGFLAHEAQEVVPEAISGEKDGMRTEEYEVEPAVMDGETEVTPAVMGEREVEDYQGIDQSKLVPLLTSALQEAVAKIEDLEKRIEILEAN